MTRHDIRHFHLFCGLGAGARGFNRGQARVGTLEAAFRCIGGIDVDPAAIRDFARLAGTPGTCRDLFDRAQYRAFHGAEPPATWREAGPDAIRQAAGGERPHIVFLSAPCKGFSGLMSEARSLTARYQALNALTLRGVWLMLEAWADDPPELILFENVPRIATRGRALLDQIGALLRRYGYAVAETTHDCGELGGLAQSRRRFLLVARHQARVPAFLYQPSKQRLRAVGEVLGRMPLPGDPAAGPMHRIPALQWRTWVRLAFVEAGSDWRSLNKLRVEGGLLTDFAIAPEAAWHAGVYGVQRWDGTSGTVAAHSTPSNGALSVADPRYAATGEYGQLGVQGWDETASTVRHVKSPIQGRFSVADPRHAGPPKHCNEFRIVPWSGPAGAVTAAHGSGQCVQDPRAASSHEGHGKYRVTEWDRTAGTVIAASTTGNGAFAVADPRSGLDEGRAYAGGGHYGVVAWDAPSPAIRARTEVANSVASVADPRATSLLPLPPAEGGVAQGSVRDSAWKGSGGRGEGAHVEACAALPTPDTRLVARITARDGTWHRPFTTLELAALQSIVDPEEQLELDGLSDAAWRERIGNAVPPAAAQAIAGVMGTTLLLAWSGQGFALSNVPIWVCPAAAALSVHQGEVA